MGIGLYPTMPVHGGVARGSANFYLVPGDCCSACLDAASGRGRLPPSDGSWLRQGAGL
jgi:hypothetical protein